jgi:lysophospholipase L1-like esterase
VTGPAVACGRNWCIVTAKAVRRLVLLSVALLVGVLAPSPARAEVRAAARRDLLFVTDSVLLGMGPDYTNAVARIPPVLGGDWDVTFDGGVSRTTSAGAALLPGYDDRDDDVVVIGLGYNDASSSTWGSRVDTVMGYLDDADLVVWVTLRQAGTYQSSYVTANATLRAKAARYDNLVLADWNAVSIGRDDVTFDGLHLTSTGARLLADTIASTIAAHLSGPAPEPPPPPPDPNRLCETPSVPPAAPDAASGSGFWVLTEDGHVYPVGGATDHGDLAGRGADVISLESTPTGDGYWLVDVAGRVHAFGDATFFGDMRGIPLNAPITRLIPHPGGQGYWLMASDGGVFTFGPGARFWGSMGGQRLNAPVISMAATPTGDGYWLIAGDGGVFAFGDALFYGSTGSQRLNAPVISMSVDPGGGGYWLYAEDGGVFTFGPDVEFHGSLPGLGLCELPEAIQLRPSGTGGGYWILARDGRIFPFGDAFDHGDAPAEATEGTRIVDFAVDPA